MPFPKNKDKRKVIGILASNVQKDFVKRILVPDAYPKIPYDDYPNKDFHREDVATHQMADTTDEYGRGYVYPNIQAEKGGHLRDYGKSAFERAKKTGDYIKFKNKEEAGWFAANNYKIATQRKKKK
jgi:hypothetical protein